MGVDSLNHPALRTDDRWTQVTLRALGVHGSHRRPGPQRRAENALYGYCLPIDHNWIALAQDREQWREHENKFVQWRRGRTLAEMQVDEMRQALAATSIA